MKPEIATPAVQSYEYRAESHGWMGIRTAPRSEPSEVNSEQRTVNRNGPA